MRSVGRYAPALLLMAIIFTLSAQSGLPQAEGTWAILSRKLAHVTEFGLLWLLWVLALQGPPARAARWALAITLAYAISDEVHQSFVDTRHPSAWDVAIDMGGAGLAAALWVAWLRRRVRSRVRCAPDGQEPTTCR